MRQSPWISTTTGESLRASARPAKRGERLVRALGEDRVGALAPELARDPERQRAVERRPVERRDRGAALERERVVPVRRVARRGTEHAQAETAAERVELLRERRVERKPVARPARP